METQASNRIDQPAAINMILDMLDLFYANKHLYERLKKRKINEENDSTRA